MAEEQLVRGAAQRRAGSQREDHGKQPVSERSGMLNRGDGSISIEQETNPWEAQAARFDFAAKKLNLDAGIWKILRYPSREIIVHIPVGMDDGTHRGLHRLSRAALASRAAGQGRHPLRAGRDAWTKCARWPAG